MDFAIHTIARDIGRGKIDAVAGGETAGIPFAAWVADRLNVPMQYVRKKPKGFGRGAQIEGQLIPGQRVLLVEDLATDGKSKVNFIKALRDADGKCDHCFVHLLLRHLSAGQEDPRRSRRHVARAHHLARRARRRQGDEHVRAEDAGRGGKVHRRSGRLVEGAWRGGRGGGVVFFTSPLWGGCAPEPKAMARGWGTARVTTSPSLTLPPQGGGID